MDHFTKYKYKYKAEIECYFSSIQKNPVLNGDWTGKKIKREKSVSIGLVKSWKNELKKCTEIGRNIGWDITDAPSNFLLIFAVCSDKQEWR
jgi:hypothetical protein